MNRMRLFVIIGSVAVLAAGIPFLPGSSASDSTRTAVLYGMGALGAVTFWRHRTHHGHHRRHKARARQSKGGGR